MRIALLADVYLPFVSGVTHAVASLREGLHNLGHEVYVFTSGPRSSEDLTGLILRHPGISLGPTEYTVPLAYPMASRRLLSTMDVVHIHHPFASGRLALRYTRGTGIPLVYTNHTRYDLYSKVYLPWPLSALGPRTARESVRRFCRRVDIVIAPSPSLRRLLESWRVEAPIEVVPNGIDLEPDRKPLPADLRQHGVPRGAPVMVFVGRLGKEKNLRFLLKAFSILSKYNPSPHLLLVGEGPERRSLEELSQAGGLKGRVHFAGSVDPAQVPSYLRAAQAFVTASLTEVHPLTVLEAIAAGLPVVAVRAPGVEDIVVHDYQGLLSAADPSDLARAMGELLREPSQRARLAANALRDSERYSIENNTRGVLSVYARALEARRRTTETDDPRPEASRDPR